MEDILENSQRTPEKRIDSIKGGKLREQSVNNTKDVNTKHSTQKETEEIGKTNAILKNIENIEKTPGKRTNTIIEDDQLNEQSVNKAETVDTSSICKYAGVLTGVHKLQIKAPNNFCVWWKWIITKDEIWYDGYEVVKKIQPPAKINKRGIFAVQELDELQKHM
ncbi:hypothetical protein FQR65_LT11090 [Abscondita terminalis]|nr:hypothetical protein FQR65_LT11090 [Abscondita terminalis]